LAERGEKDQQKSAKNRNQLPHIIKKTATPGARGSPENAKIVYKVAVLKTEYERDLATVTRDGNHYKNITHLTRNE